LLSKESKEERKVRHKEVRQTERRRKERLPADSSPLQSKTRTLLVDQINGVVLQRAKGTLPKASTVWKCVTFTYYFTSSYGFCQLKESDSAQKDRNNQRFDRDLKTNRFP